MQSKVKELIEKIRPVLNSDGGDIMFLGIENREVVICMTGNVCTVKDVRNYIVKNVPWIESVRNIASNIDIERGREKIV